MSPQPSTEVESSEDEEVNNGARHWAQRLTATSAFESDQSNGDLL